MKRLLLVGVLLGFGIACNNGQITLPPVSVSAAGGSAQQTQKIDEGQSVTFTVNVANDGSGKGVTWSLSGSGCTGAGCGTLTNITAFSVTYNAPPVDFTANVTACSVTVPSNCIVFTVLVATPPAVTTTTLPNGAVGAAYSATLQATGGAGTLTWTKTSGSLPAGLSLSAAGVISGTPTAIGTSTFTVTVTDSSTATQGPASAQQELSLTILSGPNDALLSGQYAFLLKGFDANGAATFMGSFQADGAGKITAGVADFIDPLALGTAGGSQAGLVFTGSYAVGADSRGTLSITYDVSGVGTETFTFTLALGAVTSGVATKGSSVEFDASGRNLSGVIELQDTSAFLGCATGSCFFDTSSAVDFGFLLSGADSSGGRLATVGSFSEQSSAIASGVADQNDDGTDTLTAASFTGVAATADSFGLGSVTLTVGLDIVSFDYIAVSSSKFFFVTNPPLQNATSGLQSGVGVEQTGGPFTSSSLDGITILSREGITTGGSQAIAGVRTYDSGALTFTTSSSSNSAGTVVVNPCDMATGTSGTYSVEASGRTTLTASGFANTIEYLTAPNQGFSLGTGINVQTGFFRPQAPGPFTNASLTGQFFFGTVFPVLASSRLDSGVIVFDGAGNVSGTSDRNHGGTLTANSPISDTYSVSSCGLVTVPATGTPTSVFYIVSPSSSGPGAIVGIDVNTNHTDPTVTPAGQ
jgi:Putative Ig domain